jgi:uncharacterized protein YceK
MPRTLPALALAAAIALAGGCGTICNLASNDPEPYGGVANDLSVLASPLNLCPNDGEAALWALGIWAADVGVCLVADTLTLPLVYSWDRISWRGVLPRRRIELDTDATDRPPGFSAGAVASPEAGGG